VEMIPSGDIKRYGGDDISGVCGLIWRKCYCFFFRGVQACKFAVEA
jgi:hypothetical protein